MNTQKRAVTFTWAAMGLFLSAGSMAASIFDEAPSDSSIEQCVAQVGNQANYDNASHVRHDVATMKRRTVGHLLKIDTTVYGDEDGQVIREYAATCVVGRDGVPVKFRITQSDTEA